jgi:hypothetical protein
MRRIFAVQITSLILLCLSGRTYGETIYFLVAETDPINGDSYILPLTEPNDIAHARDLIAYGPSAGQPIVVATVACGSDCINRDYIGTNKPAWQWRIADFNSFSDSQPPNSYSTPVSVNWECLSGKYIACPTYTVVYELGTDPAHWERDFDNDADVDFNDFVPLGNSWDGDCVEPDWCGGTDLDQSGKVDCNDLKIFAESWLSPYADEPTWSGNIEFACWDWKYQCKGDADNKTETLQRYRVYQSDLNILMASYNKSYPDAGYNPCADFDRNYRVYDEDVAILEANLQKKDTQLGPACHPKLICQP